METYKNILAQLNETIWDSAELKFCEHKSANAMTELIKAEGFTVVKGIADMETSYTASYGSGHPIIGILGEYDALSGLSQQADVAVRTPREGTECGHGCGHNLLGTAAVGAALYLRDYLKESQKSGTVVMVGCPAEEGGSGKAYLARAGVFDSLDVALTWHPGGGNAVMTGSLQANCQAYFRFKGISSHAAATPHLGRSALDAVELMNVGVNYLREHMEPTDRIHYAVTDTGGISPNVVQGHAEVLYLVRSTQSDKVQKLYQRVCDVARGAALMTGCQMEIVFDKACSNILSNSVLEQLLYDSMTEVSLPQYSAEDMDYANRFKATITQEDIGGDLSLMAVSGMEKSDAVTRYAQKSMVDFVLPHRHLDINIPGSSDVGDASHVVPTAQFVAACYAPGTPGHSWQMVAQGKSDIALKGASYAAKVLANGGQKIIDNPEIAQKAQDEFKKSMGGIKYQCPIPPQIKPNSNGAK